MITNTVHARFVNYKKGCTRLATASDKVYQLLAHAPGTPASFTTKTGRHDIAESGVKHKKNQAKGYNQKPQIDEIGNVQWR